MKKFLPISFALLLILFFYIRYQIYGLFQLTWYHTILYWLLIFSLVVAIIGVIKERGLGFYLTCISLLFSILVGESLLRYFKVVETYGETRSGYYISQYDVQEKSWLRTYPPDFSFNLENAEYNYPRQSNSLGFCEPNLNLNKCGQTFRIIGVGDSFTLGDGAPQDSTWVSEVERELKLQYPSAKFDVYNAGICGNDPFYSYILLREKLMPFKPDLVIMNINNSDIDDFAIRGGMERFCKDSTVTYRKRPWFEYAYALSRINRLIIHAWVDLDHSLLTKSKKEMLTKEANNAIEKCVQETAQLCALNQATLMIVMHPIMFEYKEKKYYALLSLKNSLEHMKGIYFIDHLHYMLRDSTISDKNISSYYWVQDAHNNSKGYTLLGQNIAQEIIRVCRERFDTLSLAKLP